MIVIIGDTFVLL